MDDLLHELDYQLDNASGIDALNLVRRDTCLHVFELQVSIISLPNNGVRDGVAGLLNSYIDGLAEINATAKVRIEQIEYEASDALVTYK